MRAGHDSHRSGVTGRLSGIAGIVMVSVGALLLVGVAVYYAIGLYSTSNLDDLNASINVPLSIPDDDSLFVSAFSDKSPSSPSNSSHESSASDEVILPDNSILHGALMPDGSFKAVEIVEDTSSFTPIESANDAGSAGAKPETARLEISDLAEGDQESAQETAAFPVSAYAAIYPGQQMHPKYWDAPLWAGTDSFVYGENRRPGGFQRLAADAIPTDRLTSSAKRISIPSIGITSDIEPLEIIVDADGNERYASPVNVVGVIPGTANPGEKGNGWLFGHLESPLRGEGNVFHRLPEIPGMLNTGDPIYVSVENDHGEYLYQIVSSKVVHQDELKLYQTSDATITLVTCSRRPFYDHRQLVTAKLVGYRPVVGQVG